MKEKLGALIAGAIDTLQQQDQLAKDITIDIQVERARDTKHGDFACNIALTLAKMARCNPRELAKNIVAAMPASDFIERIGIAGPGFINFFINNDAFQAVVNDIFDAGDTFGHSTVGEGKSVQVEFVSANPTGPLHVGHGRGAAYGAAVADLLSAVGYSVHREYYVNDAGRQMDILGTSVWLRYLQQCGETIRFPSNGYQGKYVEDIADQLHQQHGSGMLHASSKVMTDLPVDAGQTNNKGEEGDKETHIDALINRCKDLLGDDDYLIVFNAALNTIIADIREDLEGFGVRYEEWFSERSLVSSGAVEGVIKRLKNSGHLYEEKGAWWFRSTDFDDEKDRVVVRENGQATYFASDIAYHVDKLERGYDKVIDIWGSDHHGYVPRVKAALAALGEDPKRLDVLLVQFANLFRGGEKVQMSTRSGQFVTLRELRDEVGTDAARFFYVSRKCEQHMDFDLDLAKSQSNDNPVFYIQYAHARICSVLRQLDEKGWQWDQQQGRDNLHRLNEDHEKTLLVKLSQYPDLLLNAAEKHDPHVIAFYLRELAADFHTYYNAHQFLIDDIELRNARLALIVATRQLFRNGLNLLGMSAPEKM